MGVIYSTEKYHLLNFEDRSESAIIWSNKDKHIFMYPNGEILKQIDDVREMDKDCQIELSKEFLKELFKFIKNNPEVLKEWEN